MLVRVVWHTCVEHSLATLFSEARQTKSLVVLDDADALLRGPTGRGLQLQLARELARSDNRILMTCRVADEGLAALATRVVALQMPIAAERRKLFENVTEDCVVESKLMDELVEKSEHFSHAECVRVVRLARIEWLVSEDKDRLNRAHFEAAFRTIGPFGT
jgi:SpoVK/Ycf46/Vps4 family AAA+-type ATPase